MKLVKIQASSSSYDQYIIDTFRDYGIDIDQWLDDIYYARSYIGWDVDNVDVVDILIDRLEMYRDDGAITLPDNYKRLVGTYVYEHYDDYDW